MKLAAVSVQVLWTPYNHAPGHLMQSHIRCCCCCVQDAQDLFHHHPVIWVPKKEEVESRHQRMAGRMLGRDEVWWHDSSGLFLKYRASLQEFHLPLADRHPVAHLYRWGRGCCFSSQLVRNPAGGGLACCLKSEWLSEWDGGKKGKRKMGKNFKKTKTEKTKSMTAVLTWLWINE